MDALTADSAELATDTAELSTDTEPAALRERIRACQASYNELYARNVRLCDELTAAHEMIERLQRAEVPPPLQR
jgi:hypothetical protein